MPWLVFRAEVLLLDGSTLGSCEAAGPAKGCFLRFPLVFQKHKNRHGMPRRAALGGFIGEASELRNIFGKRCEKCNARTDFGGDPRNSQ